MQFGIFTVGDVTVDPTTGQAPTEHERIKAMVTIAKHAEEVGLDVFATGEHYGHGRADQAIVGLGGQAFMRKNSQDAVNEFRPYFDNAPVYGHGPTMDEFTERTPLTVGSPQQVIEKTLAFADFFGDYQRQLFLMDHAGLPLKTVLGQLDLLGEEVVPTLRKEFAARRPEGVPEHPPTHSAMLAEKNAVSVSV